MPSVESQLLHFSYSNPWVFEMNNEQQKSSTGLISLHFIVDCVPLGFLDRLFPIFSGSSWLSNTSRIFPNITIFTNSRSLPLNSPLKSQLHWSLLPGCLLHYPNFSTEISLNISWHLTRNIFEMPCKPAFQVLEAVSAMRQTRLTHLTHHCLLFPYFIFKPFQPTVKFSISTIFYSFMKLKEACFQALSYFDWIAALAS